MIGAYGRSLREDTPANQSASNLKGGRGGDNVFNLHLPRQVKANYEMPFVSNECSVQSVHVDSLSVNLNIQYDHLVPLTVLVVLPPFELWWLCVN